MKFRLIVSIGGHGTLCTVYRDFDTLSGFAKYIRDFVSTDCMSENNCGEFFFNAASNGWSFGGKRANYSVELMYGFGAVTNDLIVACTTPISTSYIACRPNDQRNAAPDFLDKTDLAVFVEGIENKVLELCAGVVA